LACATRATTPGSTATTSRPVNDVADLIAFLCREESSYITGVTYDVNGGSHIH
jgi:NAD(P)-dependent dehydrogenase (short-subunit alcohol dehydrogenase family)